LNALVDPLKTPLHLGLGWRFANPVGDHRAVLQLEIERGSDELLRNLEQSRLV